MDFAARFQGRVSLMGKNGHYAKPVDSSPAIPAAGKRAKAQYVSTAPGVLTATRV